MDDDPVRRGGPSVHEAYDDATAILAGDALYALAFETLGQLTGHPQAGTVFAELARTTRQLCEGQQMDMSFEHDWPSPETYEAMIEKKTAVLFAAATGNAARIAQADEAVVEALTAYGRLLGLGFQITDDVLDLAGDTETLGKPAGSDVRAGKRTHPLLEARQRADEDDRDRLASILDAEDPTSEQVGWVLELCQRTGALEASRERSRALLDQARDEVDVLEPSPARDALESLVDWLPDRDR